MSLKDQSPRCVTVSFPGVGAGMGGGGRGEGDSFGGRCLPQARNTWPRLAPTALSPPLPNKTSQSEPPALWQAQGRGREGGGREVPHGTELSVYICHINNNKPALKRSREFERSALAEPFHAPDNV